MGLGAYPPLQESAKASKTSPPGAAGALGSVGAVGSARAALEKSPPGALGSAIPRRQARRAARETEVERSR
jgi:hypothetical protein